MIKKTLYAWKPQEPSSDFAEKVMARLLADPPPHLCTAAANVAVRSLGLKSKVLTLATFIVPILVIVGLLLRAQLIQHDAPVAPPDATPRIAPSIEHPSPAPVPAPSNAPGKSSDAASRDVHPGAQPALPKAAPGGGSKGITPSIRTRGEGGSSPGDAASEPQSGPFNEKNATDALYKAFDKAKASCRVPTGTDATGTIIAKFRPKGNAVINFEIVSYKPPPCVPQNKPDGGGEEQSTPDKPEDGNEKQIKQAMKECIEKNINDNWTAIEFSEPETKTITLYPKF